MTIKHLTVAGLMDACRIEGIDLDVTDDKRLKVSAPGSLSKDAREYLAKNRPLLVEAVTLEHRLELGEMKIQRAAETTPEQVARLEDFWIDLLGQYQTALDRPIAI